MPFSVARLSFSSAISLSFSAIIASAVASASACPAASSLAGCSCAGASSPVGSSVAGFSSTAGASVAGASSAGCSVAGACSSCVVAGCSATSAAFFSSSVISLLFLGVATSTVSGPNKPCLSVVTCQFSAIIKSPLLLAMAAFCCSFSVARSSCSSGSSPAAGSSGMITALRAAVSVPSANSNTAWMARA